MIRLISEDGFWWDGQDLDSDKSEAETYRDEDEAVRVAVEVWEDYGIRLGVVDEWDEVDEEPDDTAGQ